MTGDQMDHADRRRYCLIIHDETIRLTRLLDDLLDLSVLENGQVTLNMHKETLEAVLDRAVAATERPTDPSAFAIERDPVSERLLLYTDGDRLAQVFINLIANAQKYCEANAPVLKITAGEQGGRPFVDFIDNGVGIPSKTQAVIFEKFSRGSDARAAGGAGLGLAICREIMNRLGGSVIYLPGQGGAAFRVFLPEQQAVAAQ